MIKSLSLRKLAAAMADIFHRFPVSILACLIFATTLMAEKHDLLNLDSTQIGRILSLSVCAFFWFLSTRLFAESHNWSQKRELLLAFPGFILIALVIGTSDISLPSGWLMLAGVTLLAMSAPFIGRQSDNLSFWNFNCVALTRFAIAVISTVILCGGINIILSSVSYLFDLEMGQQAISDLWIIGLALFCPLMALTGIPHKFDSSEMPIHQPGAPFLIKYILTPLVLAYMVVLYAYTLRVLIQWNLPHGEITWMVNTFGIIGIAVHLLAFPMREHDSTRLVRFFYRWFYPGLIVPLALQAVAIALRVGQYGVTESRYLVMLSAVWMGILIIGYVVNRAHVQLKYVPLVLAVLLMLSSFGPWGAQNVSLDSQYGRLQKMLSDAGILQDGKITPLNRPADFELSKNVTSIVNYLAQRNSLQRLKPWFDDKQNLFKARNGDTLMPNEYELVEAMGLKHINHWETYENVVIRSKSSFLIATPIDIRGYRFMSSLNIYSYNGDAWHSRITAANGQNDYVLRFNPDDGHLVIKSPNNRIIDVDLQSHARDLWDKNITEITDKDAHMMVLTAETNELGVKLYLNTITGTIRDEQLYVRNIDGYLLIK